MFKNYDVLSFLRVNPFWNNPETEFQTDGA